jgi:hypothetical protein
MDPPPARADKAFERAGLTAILVWGAPGITNVLSRLAIGGSAESTPGDRRRRRIHQAAGAFVFAYSPADGCEAHAASWIFARALHRGAAHGMELVISRRRSSHWIVRTRHEVATLPITFRAAGLRMCDFKASILPHDLMRSLREGQSRRAAQRGRRTSFRTMTRSAASSPSPDGIAVGDRNGGLSRGRPTRLASGAGDVDTGVPADCRADDRDGGHREEGVRASRGTRSPIHR